MIVPEDLPGVEEDTARRVIVVARSIAPCLDSIEDGSEAHKDALAILRGVARELPAAGERRVKSLSRAGTSVGFEAIRSAFSQDDRDALAALCGSTGRGSPIGSFPLERPVGAIWPETYE